MESYQFRVERSGINNPLLQARWILSISGFILLGTGLKVLFPAPVIRHPALFSGIGCLYTLFGFADILLVILPGRSIPGRLRLYRFARIATLVLLGIAALGFFYLDWIILGAIPLTLLLAGTGLLWIESRSVREICIRIDDRGVCYPGWHQSSFHPWSSFNAVILRNSLLTLDFKNNRVIQAEVLENLPPEEEIIFCRYCAIRLKSPHPGIQ